MSEGPDHLATAMDFAARAKRTRDERERARLLALAAKYREMAIGEATAFVMAMPKRTAAASVRRDRAARRRGLGRRKA
jgi:hypothetical protein